MTCWGARSSSLSLPGGIITRWATAKCTDRPGRLPARLLPHPARGRRSTFASHSKTGPRNPYSGHTAGPELAGLSSPVFRHNPCSSGACAKKIAPGSEAQARLWERLCASQHPISGGMHAHCAGPPCPATTQGMRREATAGRACDWQAVSLARGQSVGMNQPWTPLGQPPLQRGPWRPGAACGCASQGPVVPPTTGRQLPRAHASLAQKEEPLGARRQRGRGGGSPGGAPDQQSPASSHFFADPRVTWQSLGLSEAVEEALCRGGFARPSAIQVRGVPGQS